MKVYRRLVILSLFFGIAFAGCMSSTPTNERFVSYTGHPGSIKMYYKDDGGKNFGSIGKLKQSLERSGRKLVFAMNGGMYKRDRSPQGLYIENGMVLSPIDTAKGNGNFYLKPNGIFFITRENRAQICTTPEFEKNSIIKYATQSGPMLVINGRLHSSFRKGSANLQIRNGVGILPDGRVLFAMSKEPINFYDFAQYFLEKGCKDALYLDGFVSRTYLAQENHMQTDGDFGVMIAVTD